MNPLLEAFLNEAREQLEVAGTRFLDLESRPGDKEVVDELFRAVHTVKGASGLFDIVPFTSVVHAAEDVLDSVRSGELVLESEHIDLVLDALDQAGSWLDELEAEGELGSGAAGRGAALSQRLRAILGDGASAESTPADEVQPELARTAAPRLLTSESLPQCLDDEARSVVRASTEPVWLVVYEPDAQCFFQGHDPLHNIQTLPGLIWFDVQARAPWPELSSFDPYQCNLRLQGLSAGGRDTIEHHLRYVLDQVRIEQFSSDGIDSPVALSELGNESTSQHVGNSESTDSETPDASASNGSASLDGSAPSAAEIEMARTLLEAQLELLRLPCESDLWQGRIEAATNVLARLLPLCGVRDTESLENAKARALVTQSAEGLCALAEQALRAVPECSVSSQPDSSQSDSSQSDSSQSDSSQSDSMASDSDGANFATELHAPAGDAAERTDGVLNELEKQRDDAGPRAEMASSVHEPVDDGSDLHAEGSAETANSGSPAREVAANDGQRPKARALKVDQARIDTLMDLVGELVVAKNALPFLAKRAEQTYGVRDLAREIESQHAIINRLAEDLQNAVMQVRMVPVGTAFQRFPRLVRDLSRKLKKQVRLQLEDEETEADKNVVEDLADPLIHLIRNSLDHGLETPEERVAGGKSPEGTILLRATQQDDRVVIEISDDGRGIDPAFVKRKAYEKGVISEAVLETISEADALQLIFAAGFSTAQQISELSGRGVGMDVVRNTVQKVGGSVIVESTIGKGTQVRMSLPLSMAVTQVMMVRVGNDDFGVPFEAVRSMVRIETSQIRVIRHREAIILRDTLLPLYRLRSLFRMERSEHTTRDGDEVSVLVVSVEGNEIGLVVDNFQEAIDIILKPLEGVMSGFPIYSGTALLGDGRVLLVLNLKEIVRCR